MAQLEDLAGVEDSRRIECMLDRPVESHHELLTAELWDRVRACTVDGVFFGWAVDELTRSAHMMRLIGWMNQYDEGRQLSTSGIWWWATRVRRELGGVLTPPPHEVRAAAAQQQIPAGVVESLWWIAQEALHPSVLRKAIRALRPGRWEQPETPTLNLPTVLWQQEHPSWPQEDWDEQRGDGNAAGESRTVET